LDGVGPVKILFWSSSNDGSSWYRCDLPADALRWSGHLTGVTQRVSMDVLWEADVVIGSRIATPDALGAWLAVAERPAAERPRLVLDLDDDYFSLDPSNPAASYWDGRMLARLRMAARAADVVTVASEALAESVCRSVAPWDALGVREGDPGPDKVTVVQNGLHAGWLGTPRDYEADQRQLIVGWSGTASSARDFDLAAHALGRIVEYGDGQVKLRFVGLPLDHPGITTLRRIIPARLHDLVEAVPWVKHGQEYLSACSGFDIWAAPYRPDPFVEAKFPTKALEAGTLGIPLVVSDVRPYREWGGDGLVLVPDHQPWLWGRQLKELVDSAELRRRMGEAGRSRAALNIMQSVGQQWLSAIQGGTEG
jgi:glycosyltransferase involved in cell wall biosynthesis